MVKEEKQLEETSKTNTLVQKLLFAILLELDKAKFDVINWKRVEVCALEDIHRLV